MIKSFGGFDLEIYDQTEPKNSNFVVLFCLFYFFPHYRKKTLSVPRRFNIKERKSTFWPILIDVNGSN